MYASKELGAELWELSGWVPDRTHFDDHGDKVFDYSLGFILRKLPPFVEESRTPYLLTVQPNPIGAGWNAHYRFAARSMSVERFDSLYRQEEDTPENAACALAIKLFQQNILQRSTHDAA